MIIREFLSSAVLLCLALAFLWIGIGYPFGSLTAMGAGFFPVSVAAILSVVVAAHIVAVLLKIPRNRFARETEAEGGNSGVSLRSVVFVLAAPVFFGLFIRRAGFLPTVFITAFLASSALREFSIAGSLVLAAAVSVATYLLFVVGLGMPLRAWPLA